MVRPTGRTLARPAGARAAALTLWLALAALPLASCAKKVTNLDASLQPPVYPEGRPANTQMIVYPDTPIRRFAWYDAASRPAPDDSLISDELIYEVGKGAVIGIIVDSTNASAFEVYRRQASGGFSLLQSTTVHPAKTWIRGQSDLYRFSDPTPVRASTGVYVGRGVVSGLVTAQSPLSNLARLTSASVAGDLKYLGNVATANPPHDTTADSLFLMKWQAVAGAAGYWITVSDLPISFAQGPDLVRMGLPRPLRPERIHEYFVGFVPAPTTQYKLRDPGPPGTRVLTTDSTQTGANYAVRIAAVDAAGQLLSYTLNDPTSAIAVQRTPVGYVTFPLGCLLVKTARVAPPPEGPTRLQGGVAAPWANLRAGQTIVVARGSLPPGMRP